MRTPLLLFFGALLVRATACELTVCSSETVHGPASVPAALAQTSKTGPANKEPAPNRPAKPAPEPTGKNKPAKPAPPPHWLM